jgi:hypothetical protein
MTHNTDRRTVLSTDMLMFITKILLEKNILLKINNITIHKIPAVTIFHPTCKWSTSPFQLLQIIKKYMILW